MMNITKKVFFIIGLPCSGKTRAAKLICSKLNGTFISTGDIARGLTTSKEQWAETEKKDLFPLENELRAELTNKIESATTNLILVEGFTRSADQATYLCDQYWGYLPEVIEVNAGDIRTLCIRARFRARDSRDSNELEFTNRVMIASKNICDIYAIL